MPRPPNEEFAKHGCTFTPAAPARVREQVAELRDVGVKHLLAPLSHAQNIASMRRFGEQVMPAFAD
jgi:hypothetical protein